MSETNIIINREINVQATISSLPQPTKKGARAKRIPVINSVIG
jgi:hypothetical protein